MGTNGQNQTENNKNRKTRQTHRKITKQLQMRKILNAWKQATEYLTQPGQQSEKN